MKDSEEFFQIFGIFLWIFKVNFDGFWIFWRIFWDLKGFMKDCGDFWRILMSLLNFLAFLMDFLGLFELILRIFRDLWCLPNFMEYLQVNFEGFLGIFLDVCLFIWIVIELTFYAVVASGMTNRTLHQKSTHTHTPTHWHTLTHTERRLHTWHTDRKEEEEEDRSPQFNKPEIFSCQFVSL